jgi:hypothetical protein
MNTNSSYDSRREQLLAGKAMSDLDRDEQLELEHSMTEEELQRIEEYERTVASLDIALHSGVERDSVGDLTDSLKNQILSEADSFFARQQTQSRLAQADEPMVRRASEQTNANMEPPSRWNRRELLAWLTTAAASTTVIGSWWWHNQQRNGLTKDKLSRTELLASARDLVQAKWQAGKHPLDKPVTGDVVWSSSYQQGFMRLMGMPLNDPLREQYQLWIIDPLRDDEPVDGGVFDVSQAGEVIIPIEAKLHVTKPTAFAITIEKPGGVVVSKQDRLPLLAVVQ